MLCFPSALKVYDRVWCKTNWNWINLAKILTGLLWSWESVRGAVHSSQVNQFEKSRLIKTLHKKQCLDNLKNIQVLYSLRWISPDRNSGWMTAVNLLCCCNNHNTREIVTSEEKVCAYFPRAVFLFIHLDFSKWCACVLYFKWQIN